MRIGDVRLAMMIACVGCGGASGADAGTDASIPRIEDGGTDASGGLDAGADASTEADAAPETDGSAPTDASVEDASAPVDASVSDAGQDASGPDAGCSPLTEDASAIGDTCSSAADCPAAYTCRGFSGIVFTQSCQIICASDCECPAGHRCALRADKAGTWMQCDPT